MRSKIRWLTEFCNSHYVSHFAAFFIDTGAKISVVESCLWFVTGGGAGRHFRLQKSLNQGVNVCVAGWPKRDTNLAENPRGPLRDRPRSPPPDVHEVGHTGSVWIR